MRHLHRRQTYGGDSPIRIAGAFAVPLRPAHIIGSLLVIISSEATSQSATFDTVARSSPSLELSRVQALAVDSRGRIYLADGGRKAVVVLGPDGAHLYDIG